eukprot:gb/GEZJ01004216.1/.p1 GENE.gb/GEZJ01004216.1/~~gb/GEZJ01004216.1/.p1  ORF type:complete len:112 (-),score=8.73 gb/GEZJ01004216.1/:96-431(-)
MPELGYAEGLEKLGWRRRVGQVRLGICLFIRRALRSPKGLKKVNKSFASDLSQLMGARLLNNTQINNDITLSKSSGLTDTPVQSYRIEQHGYVSSRILNVKDQVKSMVDCV